jgi:hypothetical protein
MAYPGTRSSPDAPQHPVSDRAAQDGFAVGRKLVFQNEETEKNLYKAHALFTPQNHEAMFGKTPNRWSREYVQSIANAYAIGDSRTRWYIEENLVTIANTLWSRKTDTLQDAIAYIETHIAASDYGIPEALAEGAL